jgi:NAD(P)H-nitrite reductase large subunit
MTSVHGNVVEFADGRRHPFDAIVFATGYRSGIKRWLQVRSFVPQGGIMAVTIQLVTGKS